MAMTHSALAMLALAPSNDERRWQRTPRQSRKVTSHFNAFQTISTTADDAAPAYATAIRHRPSSSPYQQGEAEVLPRYSCGVEEGNRFLLQLESISPLHRVCESEWREVYVALRGTLLSIHRLKEGGAGKLLRTYTLQHAEIGLAPDASHSVLVPQTRFAHLLPASARRKAWQKDPDLFRPVQQFILRLRAETDQILLANASEDKIHAMLDAISAGIDISMSIDERSIPTQCTVPRRRRRRPQFSGDFTDAGIVAEQERILREMYPGFADEPAVTPGAELRPTMTSEDLQVASTTTYAPREEDELDLNAMREDSGGPATSTNARVAAPRNDQTLRPAVSRQTTASSIASTYSTDMMYAAAPANFNNGKWEPPHSRSAAQIQRYARRCKPILLAESVRASDILIYNGKRVKINWRMELLEEWELKPPSYKSHDFSTGTNLERTKSQSSATGSAVQSAPRFSNSVFAAQDDQITPVDTALAGAKLTKATITSADKVEPRIQQRVGSKIEEARGTEVHGVMFCF